MKKYLLSGLAILLPIALTVLILIFVLDLLTEPFIGLVEDTVGRMGDGVIDTVKYHWVIVFISRIVVLILLFFATLLLGFLGHRFLLGKLFKFFEDTVLKIPFIKRIYRLTVDVTKSFVGKKEKIFQSTVVVNFPHENAKAFGFYTSDVPDRIREAIGAKDDLKSVFVPTSPHPISGFLIMLEKNQIKDTDLTTEETFKFLVSCGLYYPEKYNS